MRRHIHIAMSASADRFSDKYITKNILSTVTVDGRHPTLAEFKQMCKEARAQGFDVLPPCDNVNEKGRCKGHPIEDATTSVSESDPADGTAQQSEPIRPARRPRCDGLWPGEDKTTCEAPIVMTCLCRRCEREDEGERFHACADLEHQKKAAERHNRVRERTCDWYRTGSSPETPPPSAECEGCVRLQAFEAYLRHLIALCALDEAGKLEGDEAEAVREQMDGPWYAMSQEQREFTGTFGQWHNQFLDARKEVERLRAESAGPTALDKIIDRLNLPDCDPLCDEDLIDQIVVEVERLKSENTCDACMGTGKPISEHPCMCGGTGKMSRAATYLRVELVAARAEVERLRTAIQEAPHDRECLTKGIIALVATVPCDCWKAAALSLSESSCKTPIEEGANE